ETMVPQIEARLGTNFETLVRARKTRKENGDHLLTERELDAIYAYASDEISFNSSLSSRPISFFNNAAQPFTTFLGWIVRQTEAIPRRFEEGAGQYTAKSMLRGMTNVMGAIIPLSLAFGAMLDWTEEEVIGRTLNRRPVNMNPADKEAY